MPSRFVHHPIAEDRPDPAADDHSTRVALRRASAFQDALWKVFPLPPVDPSIRDGRHYVVRAVYFSFDFPPVRPLHCEPRGSARPMH